MSEPVPSASPSRDRLRERFGPRARGFALALLVEALVVLMLFTLAPNLRPREEKTVDMAVFGVSPEPEPETEAKKPAQSAAPNPVRVQPSETTPDPNPPVPRPPAPQPDPSPPAMLDLPLSRMPDIAALPRGAAPPRARPT